MKLYTVPLAPNPMRVTLYLAEREALGCEFDIERITVNTLKGRHREPEHLARNSWGTLPVLELKSGQFITESLTIIDYLEDAVAGPCLRPDHIEDKAKARNIERVIEMRIALDIAICSLSKITLGSSGRLAESTGARSAYSIRL